MITAGPHRYASDGFQPEAAIFDVQVHGTDDYRVTVSLIRQPDMARVGYRSTASELLTPESSREPRGQRVGTLTDPSTNSDKRTSSISS